MATFGTKKTLFKVVGKDEEGKDILEKSGETEKVSVEAPKWTENPQEFVKHFKAVPGIEAIANGLFVKALYVDLQSKMRNGVSPENWNQEGLQKFMETYVPSKGRVKMSKEERAAKDLGIDKDVLMEMLRKAKKA